MKHWRIFAVVTVMVMTLATESIAGPDGHFDAYLGGNFTLQQEKDGSGEGKAGGFAFDLAATVWIAKVFGVKWDMLQLEGIFNKDGSWFHVGGNLQLILNLRYVYLATGGGLFYNRWKVDPKGSLTPFRVPAAVGFRWPVELGVTFWRIGIFGGLEFDFLARKHRVSKNTLLGDETTAFAGLNLNFGEKGVQLRLEWNYRMLDDDFTAHAFFLMFDLVPIVKKIMDKDDDEGWSPSPDPDPDPDYDSGYDSDYDSGSTSYTPTETTYKSDLQKNMGEFLDEMDKLDDTMSILRLVKAVESVGFTSWTSQYLIGGINVLVEVPDRVSQFEFVSVATDKCTSNQEFNSKDVVVAYCIGGPASDDADDADEFASFWKTAHDALTEQYGSTTSDVLHNPYGFIDDLLHSHSTGTTAEVFSMRSTTSAWVTLEMGVEEWSSDIDFKAFACIYYTPAIGSCSAPSGNAIQYDAVSIPVSPPWYSPGCELNTSCVVDNLMYDINGDFLEPWDCTNETVYQGMIADDAKFLGIQDLPYDSMTWDYLGQPTETRIYKDSAAGTNTLLITQRTGGKCYSAVFEYYQSCTTCVPEIKKVIDGIGYPAGATVGQPAEAAVEISTSGLSMKDFHGILLPHTQGVMGMDSLIMMCGPNDAICTVTQMKNDVVMRVEQPKSCATAEQAAQVKQAYLAEAKEQTGVDGSPLEAWKMQGQDLEVFDHVTQPGSDSQIIVHQVVDGQCWQAKLVYPTGCNQCPGFGRKYFSMVKTAP